VSTTLPSQIEVLQLADGVHFRLPPPAGTYPGSHHEVCVTSDGKLRWQAGSGSSPSAQEVAGEDLVQLVVGPFGDLAVLAVESRQGGLRAICTGYRRDWLEALAAVLRHHCRLPTRTDADLKPSPPLLPQAIASPADRRAAAVRQFGEGLRSLYEQIRTDGASAPDKVPESRENPDQPPNSRVIHQTHDNGVTLIIPPGGPGPFFLLGCGLCVLPAILTLAGLCTGFRDTEGSYGPVAMIGISWAIALAVLLPAYHNAYAHVTLAVVGDELEMLESSKVRTRRRSWNRADLTGVCCGDNGWVSGSDDSNLTPVAQLHILPKGEKKVGLLAGRDAAEVSWIATVLRGALRLPHPP
jgi:hypothetical protein